MAQSSNKLWFKRKRYGYGWYPVTWQGWAVIAVYVAVVAALGFALDENSTLAAIAVMFIIPVFIATVALLRICYKKGERPRWQWGERDDER